MCVGGVQHSSEAWLPPDMFNLGTAKSWGGDCAEHTHVSSLDSLLPTEPSLRSVFAMKLDCEGCEGAALFGARTLLAENPPCLILMEVTEQYLCDAGTPWPRVRDFLEGYGYRLATDAARVAAFEQGHSVCGDLRFDQLNIEFEHKDRDCRVHQ